MNTLIGALVSVEGKRGVAKFRTMSGDMAEIEWFCAPGRIEFETCHCDQLVRAELTKQARVFIKGEDTWHSGCVLRADSAADGTLDYEIRFSTGEKGWLNETELRARGPEPNRDPTEWLAAGCFEAQSLFESRWPLIECLTELRAAAAGLTGLVSSSIELIPHQVRAVRRVLHDPIQRYLLADEVGLGKTIEAGVIIRQLLLDHDQCCIAVACPQTLLRQWQDELGSRFGCSELEDRVIIVSHDDLPSAPHDLDLLVVDEAHMLVRGHTSENRPTWIDAGWERALAAERLLLLSATPPLGDERTLHRLLHLLDPQTHQLEDLDGFRRKVESSQEFGRVLLSLREDASRFVLRRATKRLTALAETDEHCRNLCDQLAERIERDDDPSEAVRRLREHVADTYRVHQRVVRTRRVEVEGLGFTDRGPAIEENGSAPLPHVREESPGEEDLVLAMEELRTALLPDLNETETEPAEAARFLWSVAEAIGTWDEVQFERAVDRLPPEHPSRVPLEQVSEFAWSDDRFDAHVDIATGSLKRLLSTVRRESRHPAKVVVFATVTRLLTALADRLASRVPSLQIFRLFDETEETPGVQVERFSGSESDAVLLAGASAEEGLNLQFADAIVHLDLPWVITRMEQRIGRIDRFGRPATAIRHRVVIPDDEEGSPWEAWFRCLAEGLAVFNRPVSDVQFVLPEVSSQLQRALLERGAAGLVDEIPWIRERLAQERTRLDEQAALDQEVERTSGGDFIDRILASEEDESLIDAAFDGWVRRALQFERDGTDPMQLDFVRQTRLSRDPWRVSLDEALAPRQLTFRRRIAVRRPQVSLVRPGHPLANVMERLLQWDERGIAFATWRQAPRLPRDHGTWVGFRLCFTVEASLDLVCGTRRGEDVQGLRRRAGAIFPPFSSSVWVRADLQPETSKNLLDLLDVPYRGEANTRDFALRPPWGPLERALDIDDIGTLCRQAGTEARRLLVAEPRYSERIHRAEARLQDELGRRKGRRAAVACSADLRTTMERDLREAVLDEMVAEAVRAPEVRLEAAGLVVLDLRPPPPEVRS